MSERLAVGKLTPRGLRMVVPHERLAELAAGAAKWRQAGHEVFISASPARLNRLTNRMEDTGMRVTVTRAAQ